MKLVRKYIVNLRDLVHYSLTNFGRGKELHIAGMLSAEPSYHGSHEGDIKVSPDKPEEDGGHWYFSRKEIEENSPSRQDGIDLKKESYIRKSYCTYLQDLGMRLKVPQVTIATAIIFCHRFFIHQSHAKNDRRTIATVCMFLAGKVEETPRPLKDVILVSYEIIHKKDAAAAQRIKQKEVYEQQKELILQGEKIVLATLAFDLNVLHPYKPLVEAIKKFKVAQNALAQVAWNFVNDGLRTSLCLQFKPHHVAAGAIFLAAKFLKVKLPSDGEKVWWQEFNVTPRQLEVVSNQMLELYEQNRVPSSATEAEASAADSQQPPSNGGPGNKEHLTSDSSSHGRGPSKAASSKPSKPAPSGIASPQPHADNHNGHSESTQIRTSETNSNKDHKGDNATSCTENHEGQALSNQKDKHHARNLSSKNDTVVKSPHDAIKKIDKEKLKAAYERRKACGVITQKIDPVDELERELEDVELPGASDKIEHERKQSLSKPASRDHQEKKGQFLNGGGGGFDTVEDGEVENRSPRSSTHKRKAGSLLDTPMEGKQQNDHTSVSQKQNHDYPEEKNGSERLGYSEREHKKHMQENHVSLT